jgi:hypothetical protein
MVMPSRVSPANRVPSGLNSTLFSGTLQCHDSRGLGVIKQLGSGRSTTKPGAHVPTVCRLKCKVRARSVVLALGSFHAGGLLPQSCSGGHLLPPLTW